MYRSNLQNFFGRLNSKKAKIGILITICLIIGLSIFTISRGLLTEEEVKSVEIMSEGWNDSNPEGGSWKLTKSADWTGDKKAQINLDLKTAGLLEDGSSSYTNGIDAVFIIDSSNASISNGRFNKAKASISSLIKILLENSDNKVALMKNSLSFFGGDSGKYIVTDFSNNESEIKNKLYETNNIEYSGKKTSLSSAFKEIDTSLSNYNRDNNRSLFVFYITSNANEYYGSNDKAEYLKLKEKYPNMIINAIQYDAGNSITTYINSISDKQYISKIDELDDILFKSYDDSISSKFGTSLLNYEKFEIVDYIGNDFYIESPSDIESSVGEYELTEENGKQKIIWNLTVSELKTGMNASMKLNLKYNGKTDEIGYYSTNEKIEITYKHSLMTKEKVQLSNITPVIKNGYHVIYDTNIPADCQETLNLISKNLHFIGEIVKKEEPDLYCSGYVFRGWETVENDIKEVTDETFIMPNHDVMFRATWGTLEISKSMAGNIAESNPCKYLFSPTGEIACIDNAKSEFVKFDYGISFSILQNGNLGNSASSNYNGKGIYVFAGTENDEYPIYYYRGKINNNNVIFADFCWQMIRTTNTGGIILIYNGTPSNNQCQNEKDASSIGSSQWSTVSNEPKYAGYVYDNQDSVIKAYIENWYENNMTSYTNYLENYIWCNDLTTTYYASSQIDMFGAKNRLISNRGRPSIDIEEKCPRMEDRYTALGNKNGNELLKYPIALLEVDDYWLTGDYAYLMLNYTAWMFSPGQYDRQYRNTIMFVGEGGQPNTRGLTSSYYVRPTISLKNGYSLTEGNGTPTNPYKVKYNY